MCAFAMSIPRKKLKKSVSSSDSDTSSDHELSYYTGNRLKLMQKVLKLVKPKILLSMAPPFMKGNQLSAIKTMLLEELLGISDKRLRYMLDGVNMEVDSTSESELDIKPEIDIISLDDISDNSQICISDDNCMEIQLSQEEQLDLDNDKSESNTKTKSVPTSSKITKIKRKPKATEKEPPVMNVLNLLELQARARAIRSQLAVEVCKKEDPVVAVFTAETEVAASGEESSSESVIMINPQKTLIVIPDSDEDTVKEEKKEHREDQTETRDAIEIQNENEASDINIETIPETTNNIVIDESIENITESTDEILKLILIEVA